MDIRKQLLIFSILVLLTGCDCFVDVVGKVSDENGKPIENATVNFVSRPDFDVLTDKTGAFTTGGVVSPVGYKDTIIITKKGYSSSSNHIEGLQVHELSVTLTYLTPNKTVDGNGEKALPDRALK